MVATMAKAKPKASRKGIGGRPRVAAPRVSIMSFRGSPSFADWFRDLVKTQRIPASTLIEHALILYAQEHGYNPEPPER